MITACCWFVFGGSFLLFFSFAFFVVCVGEAVPQPLNSQVLLLIL